MKTLRLLSLFVVLFGLSGCPDNNPDCFVDVGTSAPTGTQIILVGEEVRLSLFPQIRPQCEPTEGIPIPASLSVEISDPDNQLVENQAALGKPATSSATLRFTPAKQGRYHVFAAFDPVGGIQQFDMYAARNRSSEAPVQMMPYRCEALERTRRGGWLCDSEFWRDDGLVQYFNSSRLAAAGDVVWVVSPTQIQRFVDTGTELQLTGTLDHTAGAALFLLPTADELVVLHSTTFQRIVFDGTALSRTGVSFWIPGTGTLGPPLLRGLLLRTGDELATVAGSTQNGSFITLEVCPYLLKEGQFLRTTAACQYLGSEVVGFEPNALWTGSRFTFAQTFNDLRRLEWNGTQLVEQASLPLGNSLTMTTYAAESRNTLTPVIIPFPPFSLSTIRPTVPVYSAERHGILLEHLDAALTDPRASPTLLWGAPTGGTETRVRTRPSTP
ncbi:hypothetical protein [Hyalangium versicolor]|uniref:hypothetical protein n=1 Tax=Hyalangium versicolor TaxID=2861190 RepID=UPI001CC93FFA|nr:hypothetical protein [Hyalangium versicolor]